MWDILISRFERKEDGTVKVTCPYSLQWLTFHYSFKSSTNSLLTTAVPVNSLLSSTLSLNSSFDIIHLHTSLVLTQTPTIPALTEHLYTSSTDLRVAPLPSPTTAPHSLQRLPSSLTDIVVSFPPTESDVSRNTESATIQSTITSLSTEQNTESVTIQSTITSLPTEQNTESVSIQSTITSLPTEQNTESVTIQSTITSLPTEPSPSLDPSNKQSSSSSVSLYLAYNNIPTTAKAIFISVLNM